MCYYCEFKNDNFAAAIDHSVECHPSSELKLRMATLNTTSGKHGYMTKNFKCVPDKYTCQGKSIEANEDAGKLSIRICDISDRLHDMSIEENGNTPSPKHEWSFNTDFIKPIW